MNISELARRLRVNTQELHDKLPELGIDIGKKAIKIDDRLASRIMRAWKESQDRERQKAQYFRGAEKKESDHVVDGEKLEIPPILTVKDFSVLLNQPVTRVIAELMRNGVMASMNQRIDFDTAAILASDLGYEPVMVDMTHKFEVDTDKRIKEKMEAEESSDFESRAPVVVVMGHVDHGKTKLLDAIRKTNVVEGEAGGITQHIGAYQVVKKKRKITFIDTPGHEAFTAMRSRGAKVADIAILVVAANDGVKPQTVEAIKIAQNAELPIIAAINKIDLPEANPEKTKQELSQYNLLPEEWGGNTICVNISAKQNTNIDELLDNILLVADMNSEKIKANPTGEFIGTIIESHVDPGEGPVATVLVKNGTLRAGDHVAMNGVLYGKIRSMRNYKNEQLKEAPPATPAKILGLKVAPKVGDILETVTDLKRVKKVRTYEMQKQEESFIRPMKESDNGEEKEGVIKLNIILRTDVLGSQEAIIESLKKIENEDIKIEIVSKGLGNITETDIMSAEATNSVVFGFNVLASPSVEALAQEKSVELRRYQIIYELITEVKRRLQELAKPETVREELGKMEILAIFRKLTDGAIVGGKVTEGKLEPGSKTAVFRNGEFVTSGKIVELQSGKQIVSDVMKGQECGIKFVGQPVLEIGDVLEVYKEREIKKII
ncbi:translation initiation factor IF-2 [Patescibacteria group bacterium]|nr:translation initiation factor IF-2 [Patescibacteria group bacterium]